MKLTQSNAFLRAPSRAKEALWVSAKTSSAVEGIRQPFAAVQGAWQPPTTRVLIDYWKKPSSRSAR